MMLDSGEVGGRQITICPMGAEVLLVYRRGVVKAIGGAPSGEYGCPGNGTPPND